MILEVQKENWTNFFDAVGKRRFGWTTKIEVLKNEMGDQVLTDGLPMNGVTVDTRSDRSSISISVGEEPQAHQTHNVQTPVRVAYLAGEGDRREVIDIEEGDGTKTLITITRPNGATSRISEIQNAGELTLS